MELHTFKRRKFNTLYFGTIGYGPNYWNRQDLSIQSDIYSMGISFYEMLALQHPCSDKENFYLSKENIQRIVEGDYTPLTLLRLIFQIIHSAYLSNDSS